MSYVREQNFTGIDENNITAKPSDCEECQKEGTDWVICGHVGCCDSSYYEAFFKKTNHTDTVAVPNKQWTHLFILIRLFEFL
jgi:hypothetical protein